MIKMLKMLSSVLCIVSAKVGPCVVLVRIHLHLEFLVVLRGN